MQMKAHRAAVKRRPPGLKADGDLMIRPVQQGGGQGVEKPLLCPAPQARHGTVQGQHDRRPVVQPQRDRPAAGGPARNRRPAAIQIGDPLLRRQS